MQSIYVYGIEMRQNSVLVAGGAGFLGSHVCDRLIGEGKQVFCLDNLLTGRRKNIEHLASNPNFYFIEADICDGVPAVEVGEIWNLACPASPPRYQKDPVHTMLTNVLGMRNCLELGRRTDATVFQASTSEVYGDPEVHPQAESYKGSVSCIGPRACYDEGKRAAEALCFDYQRTFGTRVKVVRIFNTYGPRMDPEDGRVVSNFIVRSLQRLPLEFYGHGLQTRSFCYVDDLIDGFFAFMRSPDHLSGPINLGNPDEFTVRELAQIVLRMTGSSAETVLAAAATDDPKQRRPDISLAAEHLGWRPKVSLADGLARTILYFRDELAASCIRSAAQ